MANHYVRSSDGDNADDGSTWTLAKATLNGVTEANGDYVFVADDHLESYTTTQSLSFGGSISDPTWILCVDDTSDPTPPTAVATGARFSVSGSGINLSISGNFYMYGMEFRTDLGFANSLLNLSASEGNRQVFENCTFRVGDGSAALIQVGGIFNGLVPSVEWINCSAETGNQGGFSIFGEFVWRGGALLSQANGGTIFRFTRSGATGRSGRAEIRGVDFSAMSTSSALVQLTGAWHTSAVIADCRLPTGWTGTLLSVLPAAQATFRVSMYNCDSGDTNYRLWIEDIAGSIREETTIVKSGGASDGTTPLAWKMTTASVSAELYRTLFTDNIPIWVDTTTSKTIEVDFIHDGTTNLQNDEVWLEVSYPGDASYPTASFARDKRATVLATPADHASSGATWTTTGLTNPNKQKLSVTFTPQNKGVCYVRVALAKASQTIYVDPKPTVT